MRKLLAAEWVRLRRSRLLWLGVALLVISNIFSVCLAAQDAPTLYSVETIALSGFSFLPLIDAVVISWWIGGDYDQGILRQKLTVGHTRTAIFLANFVLGAVASLMLLLVMLASGGMLGYAVFRTFTFSATDGAHLLLCCLLIGIAIAAICVTISMAASSRAAAVVLSLCLMVALIASASILRGVLFEAGLIHSISISTFTNAGMAFSTTNPHILTLIQWLYDLLPSGQISQIMDLENPHWQRWSVLSLVWILCFGITGACIFRHKDIK